MVVPPIDGQVRLLEQKLESIRRIEVPRANAKALNDTARVSKNRAARGVSKQTKIKVGLIKKKVFVKRATTKQLVSRVRAYREGIAAISMMTKAGIATRLSRKGRPRRGGVRVAGRQYRKAFVADGSKGHGKGRLSGPQVLRRTTSARFPLEVVKIPVKHAVDQIVPRVVAREMRSNYHRRLRHELQYRLQKYEARS